LSPLSPGFAILPRRRRVSGLGTRYQDGDDEVEDDDGESGRRRLSESDLVEGSTGPGEEVVRASTGLDKGKGKNKSRWGWLRKLTRR
jgi:hypothetical protein